MNNRFDTRLANLNKQHGGIEDRIDDLYRLKGLPVPGHPPSAPSIGRRFVAGAAEEATIGAAATDGATLLPSSSDHQRTP